MLWKIERKQNSTGGLVAGVFLTMLALPVLFGCADEGAGGFTELDGIWNGSFQQGAIPSGSTFQPLAHSSEGIMSLNFSTDDEGNITGTATMTPDICADGATQTGGDGGFGHHRNAPRQFADL